MGRRRSKSLESPRVRKLKGFEDSRFWRRLTTFDTDLGYQDDGRELAKLRANVGEVVENAGFILDQINRHLPQYTLHNETHILNVLGLMDALTPYGVMERLEPLECAVCILAAYTHDLGMALRDEEYRDITDETGETPKRQRFLRFRDRYGEEVRQVERLRKTGAAGDRQRAEYIEAHILAEYIRTTHADGDAARSRVNGWLEAIKAPGVANNASLFTYKGTDFQQWLVLIGASHGRDATWLREQWIRPPGKPDAFLVLVGSEWVNLAFPGLLLRLADIMDFDASRTPRILFRHVGIDNTVSLQEWNKHLSITGWSLETPEGQEPRLTYSAHQCEHPVFEKSIRDFGAWIDAEIRWVREELRWQRHLLGDRGNRYDIHLPHAATLDIKPAGWPQASKYTYRDLQFRLDQDEIQQLLMGESLYGDPGLCIRELLQNALDALELREFRLKIADDGRQTHEPVDPLRKVGGRPEELRVVVTWGHDKASGQDFLRVTDDGVGMTERVITEYFIQVGKSYYRSPEFHQERAALRAAGLLSSPISIFGIGILSCFMIADRLEVRTRPGGANEADRAPRDITISGPGSLFWLRRGTLGHQGTEVTLYLKRRFRIEHDPKKFEGGLRMQFGYSKDEGDEPEDGSFDPEPERDEPEDGSFDLLKEERDEPEDESIDLESEGDEPEDGSIDPAFIAACHVVWPRYPIDVQVPGGTAVRIDDRFHLDRLARIDRKAVVAKAKEWDCPESFIGEPEWGNWEWDDSQETGSRIRLWFPRNHYSADCPNLPANPPEGQVLCRQDELASFVEPQLQDDARTMMLVRGMFVSQSDIAFKRLGVTPSVGSRVWIDLRGDAAPQLTADRMTMLVPEEGGGEWHAAIDGLFERACRAFGHTMECAKSRVRQNGAYEFLWKNKLVTPPISIARNKFCLLNVLNTSFYCSNYLLYTTMKLCQSFACDFYRDVHLGGHLAEAVMQALGRRGGFVISLADAADRARDLARNRDLASDLASTSARHLDNVRSLDLYRGLRTPKLEDCLYASLLQEAFRPELSSSWPLFKCRSLRGHIGNATLTGPGLVEFDLEDDQCTVYFTDPEGNDPASLVSRGYDLTFPMPAIPLGSLRRNCNSWRINRRYQPLGVTPFLFPELHRTWPKHTRYLQKAFRVPRIFALLPRIDLWSEPFADWTDEDWSTCGLSALWDIETGVVLWAHGAHHVDDMRTVGRPAPEFFDQEATS